MNESQLQRLLEDFQDDALNEAAVPRTHGVV